MRSTLLSNLISRRSISLNTRPKTPIKLGQPTYETRPHIIPKPGNLTPGISALEYFQRRLKLASTLPDKSLAIIIGNTTKFSSGSVFYDFQQDNDFYYLTGWLEPDSIMVLEKKGTKGDDDVVLHMLVPPKNQQRELWEGAKTGLDGAFEFFNADCVEDVSKASTYIKSLVKSANTIFYDNKYDGKLKSNSPFSSFFNFGGDKSVGLNDVILNSGKPINPLTQRIASLRKVKSPAEIEVMHAAGQISSRAINKAIGQVGSKDPIATEKTLAKYLEYQFVRGGCDKQAYIPVVASGSNALTIHYTRNDDLLYRDELVFVDAGGKLGGYCADISRTWPNSTKGFSEPQRDLYEAVLNTNKKCIELCNESLSYSLHDIHEYSVTSLRKELSNVTGFQNLSFSDVSRYLYPHYIGHHLGLDLHDVPSVSRFEKLVAGNVITIEPGLYIPEDDRWPKHFQGIGVRVEDDVVVGKTNDEIINLTSGCVKEVVDIESLINGGVTTPGIDDELVVLDI
ncbi:Icp55 protein [Candida orthopsilosis Co 90-125]|uniref:Icp55 protein n=1 Tax=Candida orthopsilosis (strain 90-125) TaxID=1136231 RepID=H8X3W6_CANO9|nr:Icp55 protein [Candida orthopsilosis Co 90-125]CCG25754.1 Icp55 protein [Candida orthopsilosis Co 90-125]